MTNRPIPDPNDPVERGHRRLVYALMPGGRRLDLRERRAMRGVLFALVVARDQRDHGKRVDVDGLLDGVASILGRLAADQPITREQHDRTCSWRIASQQPDGTVSCARCGRAYTLTDGAS